MPAPRSRSMNGPLGWALFILVMQSMLATCDGKVVLEEAVAAISGQAGDILLESIVSFHLTLGLQELEFTENMTVVGLNAGNLGKVCELLQAGETDEVKAMFRYADVLLYSSDLSCAETDFPLGTDHAREYHKLWCDVSPITISVVPGWFPGVFANLRTEEDSRLADWMEDNHPCYWLSSSGNAFLDDFFKNADELLFFNASVATDENIMANVLASVPTVLLFQVCIPLLYAWSFYESLTKLVERFRLRKLTGPYQIILGLNLVQSLFYMGLNIAGLHFITNWMPAEIHMLFYANSFGLSVSTDIVFALLVTNVKRRMNQGVRSKPLRSKKTLLFAALVAILDFGCTIYYLIKQNREAYDIMATYMPAMVALVGFVTLMVTVSQVRMLARLFIQTLPTNVAMQENGVVLAQGNLARVYLFWSKVTIFSALAAYLALSLTATGIWAKGPFIYLFVIFLVDIGKVLNMVSQSKCCAVPKRTPGKHRQDVQEKYIQPPESTEVTSTSNNDALKDINLKK